MNKRSISLEEYSLEINRRGGRRLDADCRAFPDGNGSSPGKRAFLPFFLPPFHLLFRFLALPHTPSGRIRQRPTVLHRIVHRNAGSNGRTDGGRILSRGGFYISLPSRRGKFSVEQAIRRLRHILRDHGQYGRELLFRSNDLDHHRPHHDQPLRHAVRQDYSGVLCRLVLLQGLYAG